METQVQPNKHRNEFADLNIVGNCYYLTLFE
jgi:hypothetical protein